MSLPPRLQQKPKRDSRWRSQSHLTFVRKHHCAMPGCMEVPIEAAHVRLGSGAGMGQKPDDHRAVPLCRMHHTAQHAQGEDTFWRAYRTLAGQAVDDLIDALCKASPKAREIAERKRERSLAA